MLLNANIQVPFKNLNSTVVKAGDVVIVGQRTQHKAVLGVAVADVGYQGNGLLETSGIFSFDESDVKNVGLYQQVYAYNPSGTIKAKFSLTPQDGYVYAGISLTNRTTEGGPLVLALGYNSPVYKAAAGASAAPSGKEAGAMSDSSTVVEPSNSSGPGAM